jgi:hypothetical protein
VTRFSADWLALREPADAAARSMALASFIATHLQAQRSRGRLVDLGGGTGANIRYLSPKLPWPQEWTIVDSDAQLLAVAPAGVAIRHADLNVVVNDHELFRESALVTASALLDLVSDAWLVRLVEQCAAAASAVLFVLTYDGKILCEPRDPTDDDVRFLVNEHQNTDKGFGVALGPAAEARVAELLTLAGYDVRRERSDWMLGSGEAELQRQLISGWADAASELKPTDAHVFAQWRDRRIAHVDAGSSRIVVGHVDVAGIRRRA